MLNEKIHLKKLPIELVQFLKYSGLAETGGHAKIIISDGLVKVNGQTETKKSKKLHQGDLVEIDQKIFEIATAEN